MQLNNLQKRILSALCIVPAATYVVYYGSWLYTAWVLIVALLMLYEWQLIVVKQGHLVFNSRKWLCRLEWFLLGIIYVSVFAWSMIALRSYDRGGLLTMWLFAVVCLTDTGAYFVGTLVGGPKIAPMISPSKTWSGLLGGIVAASGGAYLFYAAAGGYMLQYLLLAPFIASMAQAGDFLESAFKRKFGVKDSGNLIPGHGGVMDRVDGFVTAAAFLAVYVAWMG